MASGEEARRPLVTHSPVSLESLFPVGESEQASGDENPELVRLRERLQGWLSQYESLLLWVQRLVVWERPLHSIFVAFTLNTLFWLLSSTSLRPIFLLSVSLLGLMLLERWKHKLPLTAVRPVEANPVGRERVQPQLLSLPELSHHLAESYLTFCLFLQETLQYKRQNHGKFCAMVCCSCLVLMGVGHYVPGIMISYIIALSVLLWPLVVYHELIQRMYTGLEPILMKLDYSMKGDPELRKRKVKKEVKEVEEGDEPRVETESESEEELSCFAPTVDVKTTALAMAITDSELSDEEASILESGGFSVSRATTPQLTDVSEDLDQQSVHSDPEEAFLRDLPEFPSVEEFPSLEQSLLRSPRRRDASPRVEAPGEGVHLPLSPAGLLLQHLASPLHFVNTHFNGHGVDQAAAPAAAAALLGPAVEGLAGEETEEAPTAALGPQRSLEALSQEIVSSAISTVVQNTLSALLRSTEASEGPSLAPFLPTEGPPSGLESDADAQAPEDTDVAAGAGPDDTPVPTPEEDVEDKEEEEDFELLDQSELEQVDEGRSSDRQAPPSDTPPSPRQPLDS